MKSVNVRKLICLALCLCVLSGQGAWAAYTTLRIGDEGESVLKMQHALISLGYSLSADGKFGSGTQRIVISFQKDHGLTYDGLAGNITLTLLYSLADGTDAPSPSPAPSASPAPTPAATAVNTYTATVKTSGGSLNLRASALSGAKILAQIPYGTILTITQKGPTWCKTSYNGYTGYVMTTYLSFGTPATSVPTAVPTVTPAPSATPGSSWTATVKTSGGSLNLRSSASLGANALVKIPYGTKLTITEKGKTWCKTSYAGYTGYVQTAYLSFGAQSTATPSPAATATPSPTAAATPALTAAATASPTPVPYDTTIFARTLRLGYTGRDVDLVQARLITLQYLASPASGRYDAVTIAAVKLFQKYSSLQADGLAGTKTFIALFSANAIAYSSDLDSYESIRIDDKDSGTNTGAGVTRLQTALKALGYSVSATGSFNESTHNAVVAFQLRNSLTPEGVADAAMQIKLYGGNSNGAETAINEPSADEGRIDGPSTEEVSLLHWYNVVKPSLSGGQSLLVYDPGTGLSWTLRVYSKGQHADSEPKTIKDTQIMNRSFGRTSWDVHAVYIRLPDGRWTMSAMHNRPHLYGAVSGNGFSGHLCVHFLRDLAECQQNAPGYGMTNQTTLRNAWKALTGEIVD